MITMTTDEMLDFVAKKFVLVDVDAPLCYHPYTAYDERVDVALILADGAALSSKSICCIQQKMGRRGERFDVYHDVCDRWEEMSRRKMKLVYPQEGKIWGVFERGRK